MGTVNVDGASETLIKYGLFCNVVILLSSFFVEFPIMAFQGLTLVNITFMGLYFGLKSKKLQIEAMANR